MTKALNYMDFLGLFLSFKPVFTLYVYVVLITVITYVQRVFVR